MPVKVSKSKLAHQDPQTPLQDPYSASLPSAGPAGQPWEVSWMPVSEVHPYYANPRVNEDAVPLVARSIKEFGFRVPIVVDEDMTIIMGHTRRLAAISLGLTHVPVHIAKDLSPEKARALRLVDNKVGERAEWDQELLQTEGLAVLGDGFNLSAFGFDMSEFEDQISKLPKDSYLEDFSVVPKPKPQWVLISCDYETAAEIMDYVKGRAGVIAHTTSQTNSKLALKNLGKKKHKG